MSAAAPVPLVKSLACPNCGGTVTLRSAANAVNATCVQCLSILDATTPSLKVLQTFQAKERFRPLIPLGTRGLFNGVTYEAIGFQVRAIVVDGVVYRWSEYLLFNPYHGYRYLSEYEGHWNNITTVHNYPKFTTKMTKKAVIIDGRAYRHFQTSEARTVYVMGEFPWQVRFGDENKVEDYIAPPYMTSSEEAAGEVTWSVGEYMTGAAIWQAFKLQGNPPEAKGIFANQPSPYKTGILSIWRMYAMLMMALIALVVLVAFLNRNEEVFRQRYSFATNASGEASFVTPVFELKKSATVEVEVKTDLSQDWAYFNFALINEDTGVAYNFGREVSYYSGRDSDGSWSEGGKNDSVTLPAVPAGHYYLRVEPEMENATNSPSYVAGSVHAMNYELIVKEDVPRYWMFFVSALLLLIPPIFTTLRIASFETKRWAESDYGSAIGSSSGDDDD